MFSTYTEPDNNIGEKTQTFLKNHGISFKDTTNSLIVTCPLCFKEKLYFSKLEANFICFSCSENLKGSTPYYALSLLTNIPIQDIKSEFEVIESKPVHQVYAISKVTTVYIPQRFIAISDPEAIDGANYLFKRGIDLETAAKYNIKYDPKNRMVVFLCKEGSHYVGYQSRAIDKDVPKEKQKYTMSGFEKSKHFLFQEYIKGDSVILAEGPVSAIKFAKTGISFVASMGKAISKAQVDKLLALGVKNVYLGLDRDAFKEINIFIKKYSTVFDIYYLKVPDDEEDFGSCSFEKCVNVYRNSKYVFMPLEFDAYKLGKWCF